MDGRTLSADELEVQADRVRGQIGATVDRLRARLTPRNILEDFAERSGVRDLSAGAVFDFTARRHPLATIVVGLGAGLLAFSAARTGRAGPGVLRETIDALSRSASKTFKERAEAKRREFVRAAEAHMSAGADHLGDAVDKGIGELVSRAPAPEGVRPLIESALQVLVIAALEAALSRGKR